MIGAIIQARMGSTRFPGKVLADLCGQPVLRRVIDRVSLVPDIDLIAVITSREPQDNEIAKACEGWRVLCYRGSEKDVLDRYFRAAALYRLKALVRITADCPLHDPQVISQVIQRWQDTHADYGSNVYAEDGQPCRTYPDGLDVEVATVEAMQAAWDEAADPFEREHVMPYIVRRPDRFKLACLRAPTDYGHLRWTLDTPEDLEIIRGLYARAPDTDYRKLL